MARELSQAGFTVLVFEQGPRLAAEDFEHDELKYFFLNGITNSPKISPQTFRKLPTRNGAAALRRFSARRPMRASSAAAARTSPPIFGASTKSTSTSAACLGSIAGTGFADWPITYQELEPYYTKVEWEVGVSGLAYASPFDPPRSKPYPMPPLPVKSSGRAAGARRPQARAASVPGADGDHLAAYRGRAPCVHCGFCMGFGCEARAKSSTLYTMIPEAEATGRCEIRADSYVFRVEVNAQGRTTGVHYFDADKREHFQPARAVVLSANGAETARLLLNSTSNRFAHGLANSSGVVGKYLMFNQGSGVQGVFEHPLNEYKSVQVTRILHDFYDSDPKRGFYGGGGIDARINPQPALWALDARRRSAALGQRVQGTARGLSARHGLDRTHHVAAAGVQQRQHRPDCSRTPGAYPPSA